MILHQELTEAIIGAAIDVHRELGPGLLESPYELALCSEFRRRNIPFLRQVELPILYKGESPGCNFKIDVLVDDKVVVELKAVEKVLDVHEAQLLTYLKLSRKRVGLLINFNVAILERISKMARVQMRSYFGADRGSRAEAYQGDTWSEANEEPRQKSKQMRRAIFEMCSKERNH